MNERGTRAERVQWMELTMNKRRRRPWIVTNIQFMNSIFGWYVERKKKTVRIWNRLNIFVENKPKDEYIYRVVLALGRVWETENVNRHESGFLLVLIIKSMVTSLEQLDWIFVFLIKYTLVFTLVESKLYKRRYVKLGTYSGMANHRMDQVITVNTINYYCYLLLLFVISCANNEKTSIKLSVIITNWNN